MKVMQKIFNDRFREICRGSMLILGCLCLTGCASYNASALSQEVILGSTIREQESVQLVAKAFSKADCKKYLDRDVLRKGYQPVQIFIQNNTNNSLSFSVDRINLPHASPEEVARNVHTSTVGRAVGYGAGALLIAPLAIPAIVDGVMSAQANAALDDDFYSKTAKDQTISPYSFLNAIIFVPCANFLRDCSITLISQKTGVPVVVSCSIQ
jgi:hypothetical protein